LYGQVGLGDKYIAKACFNIFITNFNEAILPKEKAREFYCLRWQIGLVYYVKQKIMQSDIIKYTHYQFINPVTLQYHFA